MSVPVLTFFNNKSGVGKTSLVYHLAWMFSELGHTIVAVDLDAQANLTAAYLDEDELERLWEDLNARQNGSERLTRKPSFQTSLFFSPVFCLFQASD
jgi:cellulose biosynthesis protein BcsQ